MSTGTARPLRMAPNTIEHFYRGGQRIADLRGLQPRLASERIDGLLHWRGQWWGEPQTASLQHAERHGDDCVSAGFGRTVRTAQPDPVCVDLHRRHLGVEPDVEPGLQRPNHRSVAVAGQVAEQLAAKLLRADEPLQ